jgi:hypothetical protein
MSGVKTQSRFCAVKNPARVPPPFQVKWCVCVHTLKHARTSANAHTCSTIKSHFLWCRQSESLFAIPVVVVVVVAVMAGYADGKSTSF